MNSFLSRIREKLEFHPVLKWVIKILIVAVTVICLDLLVLSPISRRKTAYNFSGGMMDGILIDGDFYYTNGTGFYRYDPASRRVWSIDGLSSGISLAAKENRLYYTARDTLYCYDPESHVRTALFTAPERENASSLALAYFPLYILNGNYEDDEIIIWIKNEGRGWLYEIQSGKIVPLQRRDGESFIELPDGRTVSENLSIYSGKKTESHIYEDGTEIRVTIEREKSFRVSRWIRDTETVLLDISGRVESFWFDGEWLFTYTRGWGGIVDVYHIGNKHNEWDIIRSFQLK